MTDKLGDRIKEFYENRYRSYLPRRMPAIIRIDGKAFHSFTKGFKKPYDLIIRDCMTEAATELCKQIQGAKIGYVQSDEISILVTDYDDIKTDAWFDKNIQKVSSISASIATIGFNRHFNWVLDNYDFHESPKQKDFYEKKQWTALFDSRCFVLPKEEVVNYFIWRQNDATRNAIQGLGQEHFSAKQCKGVDNSQMQEKLFQEKQINFNDEPTFFKRGWTIVKTEKIILKPHLSGEQADHMIVRHVWEPDYEMPILTTNRNYIQKYV